MVDYPDKRREIAFNIGLFQAQFVYEVYRGAFQGYLQGNLDKWYWYLQVLRDILNPDLKEPEREVFDAVEKEAKIKNSSWKRCKNKSEYIKLKIDYVEYVRKRYEWPIISVMREVGYMPTKRDRARLGF